MSQSSRMLAAARAHLIPQARGTHDAVPAHVMDRHLTQREADVLVLLRQDRSNAQVALELQIGIETVRTHARNIYLRPHLADRRHLS